MDATRLQEKSDDGTRPTEDLLLRRSYGALDFERFRLDALHAHCVSAIRICPEAFSEEQKQVGESALANWSEPKATPSGIKSHGHNILLPNHMSLARAGRSLEPGKPFIGRSEGEYSDLILESAAAVARIREDTGIFPVHFLTLPRPGIVLAERMNYKPFKPEEPFDERAVQRTIRLIQTQKGLCSRGGTEALADLSESPAARSILAMRQSELETFTLGVGLHAAQTASAVIRLSPGVNHVFPALSAYARSVRSNTLEARMKVSGAVLAP